MPCQLVHRSWLLFRESKPTTPLWRAILALTDRQESEEVDLCHQVDGTIISSPPPPPRHWTFLLSSCMAQFPTMWLVHLQSPYLPTHYLYSLANTSRLYDLQDCFWRTRQEGGIFVGLTIGAMRIEYTTTNHGHSCAFPTLLCPSLLKLLPEYFQSQTQSAKIGVFFRGWLDVCAANPTLDLLFDHPEAFLLTFTHSPPLTHSLFPWQTHSLYKFQSSYKSIMGVTKQTLERGNGKDIPRPGNMVAIHYTGALFDPSKADKHNMGFQYAIHCEYYTVEWGLVLMPMTNRFDTSKERGPLKIPIGIGRVIKGVFHPFIFISFRFVYLLAGLKLIYGYG